jgi:predicted lipoprotein with Yx(FWY)xxD motif
MKLFLLVAVVLAAAAVLAPAAMSEKLSARATLTVRTSSFGRVIFDGRGFVVYGFTRDRGRSACYGACARAWPPYVAPKGGLRAGAGLKRSLLGTVKRSNGTRQVTYAGKPLYHYVGDTHPGQILCQNVVEYGGRWLIVRPKGKLLR